MSDGLTPPEDIPAVSAEDLVEGEHVERDEVDGEPPRQRWFYPSTIGGVFYLLFLAVAILGVAVVVFGPWRTGIRIFAAALLAAALTRALLPSHQAGMLGVRNKAIDAGLLTAMGVAILILASSIPEQPL